MKSNKRERLMRFCRFGKPISKAAIMDWGLTNFYISADRVVRKWVEDGLMHKLTKQEMKDQGLPDSKMAWYSWKGESNG